ncbi:hypothetical protein HK102_012099 [Quaeritorhiza haematococci]|nr:hypothetical protein HK102_012099 [Quaeritorhiza haematococci]
MLQRIASNKKYVAFISLALTCSVQSVVDEISEQGSGGKGGVVGYDFDDWTERLLQSYLVKGMTTTTQTPALDKLSFLLDEIEGACEQLKYSPDNKSLHRAVLIFDGIDHMDLQDDNQRKALGMIFNAANKWAQEDLALVLFTLSDRMYGQVIWG